MTLRRQRTACAAVRLAACACVLVAALFGMAAAGGGARATEISQELAARLTPAQQQLYLAYREARAQFDKQYRA